ILERFGFTGSFERISHDCVNQIEDPDCRRSIVSYPEPEVLKELRLEYSDPLRLSLHRPSLYEVTPLSPVLFCRFLRDEAPSSDGVHCEGNAVDGPFPSTRRVRTLESAQHRVPLSVGR